MTGVNFRNLLGTGICDAEQVGGSLLSLLRAAALSAALSLPSQHLSKECLAFGYLYSNLENSYSYMKEWSEVNIYEVLELSDNKTKCAWLAACKGQ